MGIRQKLKFRKNDLLRRYVCFPENSIHRRFLKIIRCKEYVGKRERIVTDLMKDQIIKLQSWVVSAASAVGKREHDGPIGNCFTLYDATGEDKFGKDTWEKAESEMQRLALKQALEDSSLEESDIGAMFAGDLLNQCVGSAYGLLDFDIPYFGLYGACSTAAEGIMLASVMTSYGIFDRCAAVTSSHYCSAERQYRTPIEYGGQRPPTAQWTVTGSGAFIIGGENVGDGQKGIKITEAMPGIVVEKGITDANNMGAAMAPATAHTLLRYFSEGRSVEEVDLIVTGDLGYEGGAILCDIMEAEGVDMRSRYNDCGMMIYSRNVQDTHAGGSGCGCSATVMASYLLPKVASGEIKRLIFLGTGAMMSPDSIKQGSAIPAVAHLVRFEHSGE